MTLKFRPTQSPPALLNQSPPVLLNQSPTGHLDPPPSLLCSIGVREDLPEDLLNNSLVHGDIVFLKSNRGYFLGKSITQMKLVASEEPAMQAINSETGYSEYLLLGGQFFKTVKIPTLTAAQIMAVPVIVESMRGAGPIVTGDSAILRALDAELNEGNYLVSSTSSSQRGLTVGGSVRYGHYDTTAYGTVPWSYTWTILSGEVAGAPVHFGQLYSLSSVEVTDSLLTQLPDGVFYQGGNMVVVNPIMSEDPPTTWSFQRLARLLKS